MPDRLETELHEMEHELDDLTRDIAKAKEQAKPIIEHPHERTFADAEDEDPDGQT